jgi:predicted lipoprotein with Yx(FWY)xxD motif
MREHHFILAGALALVSTAALAEPSAGGAVVEMATAKGTILTDAKGMTLYTFDNDGNGSSACYDGCAKKWPPLAAAKTDQADGDYRPLARRDGTMQWSHDGKPLYHWQMDKKPGDVTGDGIGGVWHVAKE